MAEICLSSITDEEEEDKGGEKDGVEGGGGTSFIAVDASSVNLASQCFQSIDDSADDTEEDEDKDGEEDEDEDDEDTDESLEEEGNMDPVITGAKASEEMMLLIPLRESRL